MINPTVRDIAFEQLGIKYGIGHNFSKYYERRGRIEIHRENLIALIMDMYNAGYYQGLTAKVTNENEDKNTQIREPQMGKIPPSLDAQI